MYICTSKLIFQLWTHDGNQLESVAKDSIVHHLAVPDMVKGGRIRFEAGELPSSNPKINVDCGIHFQGCNLLDYITLLKFRRQGF